LSAAWLEKIRGNEFIDNDPQDIGHQDMSSTEDVHGGISLVIPLKSLQSDGTEVDLIEWEKNRLEKMIGEERGFESFLILNRCCLNVLSRQCQFRGRRART
jgi:hypothetical protein